MRPLVAVLVPVYEQPQFMAGAVLSALEQRPPVRPRVVIVNDGCPFPETHATGEALARAHPDRVVYVRQENAGLAAARNAALERALGEWPELDAVFPLDADNLLSPWTLGALWEQLQAQPDADWATPAVEAFGEGDSLWEPAPPFSAYRQRFENQCDAGTLFRRAVFDSGLRYDPRIDAFADWRLVLEAALAGRTGILAGPCGFRYRVRGTSMLAAATPDPDGLRAGLEAAYAPAELLEREHAEAPRFALVGDDVRWLAATDLPSRRTPVAEWADAVTASRGGLRAHAPYVPPVTVLGSEALFTWLEERGRLAGVLLALQRALRDHEAVAIGAAALAVRTRDLHRADGLATAELAVELPRGLPRAVAAPPPHRPPARADRTLSAFSAHLHLDEWETAFPHAAGDTWVLGADPAARALAPGAHLVDVAPAERGDYATATATTDPALVRTLLAGARTVIHAGGPPEWLRAAAHAQRVALVTGSGEIAGEDALIDRYVVTGEDERRRLENLGAVPEKISLVERLEDARL